MSDQDLPELIAQLVELDEEIRKRMDDLKMLIKRHREGMKTRFVTFGAEEVIRLLI